MENIYKILPRGTFSFFSALQFFLKWPNSLQPKHAFLAFAPNLLSLELSFLLTPSNNRPSSLLLSQP